MQDADIKIALKNWAEIVSKYQENSISKATIQIVTSFGPFIAIWVLMYYSLGWSYWITLGLAVLNALFLVRIFIIQHDCGHQSFLKSRKWNNAIGLVCSLFSIMPYKYWARSHDIHHAHCGQLEEDVRDIGDIHVKTVNEFRTLSPLRRLGYRLYRFMPFILIFGPIYYALILMRFPVINRSGWKKTRLSLIYNNIYIAALWIAVGSLVGFKAFFLIQVPILIIFFMIAVWFFYIHHQHEGTYKQWKENWVFILAAVKGCTYYKLPRILQWFSGNIGFHHIHHLSSKIPNYNLEKCAKENPIFNKYVTTLTLRKSLDTVFNHLWDEELQQMISFRKFYQMERKRAPL